MGDDLIVTEVIGSTAWIRLNRPQTMNPISQRVLDDLAEALDLVENDPSVRVIVLTGSGKSFCAGAELTTIAGPDGSVSIDNVLNLVRQAGETYQRLLALPKPVIAAVNGFALAGGLELLMACDIVIAAHSARIGNAHANYGLISGSGGETRLARIVGPMVGKYMAFTGNSFRAADLVPLGLVNEVVPDDELFARVSALADQLASKSPRGLGLMKRSIEDGLEQPMVTAMNLEHQAMALHLHSSTDMQEGFAAFREKRQPVFESPAHRGNSPEQQLR